MFEIKLIFYSLSCTLQFSEFVWALSYSVWDVFNNFLLIDATNGSKISGDHKRFFIALSLYPLSFFANTPFNFVAWQSIFCADQSLLHLLLLTFWRSSFSLREILFFMKCFTKEMIFLFVSPELKGQNWCY